MNEPNEFSEKVVAAISSMEGFLTKDSSTGAIVNDARNTAEELLRKFEEDLKVYHEAAGTNFDDANLAFVWQIDTLKQKVADISNLEETNLKLGQQLEKVRHDYEQAAKEKHDAVNELNRIQKLWERTTSG